MKDGHERKRWKLRLIRLLYERGYEKKNILELFRFIDWLLALPAFLEEEFSQEVFQMKEEKMPYITSVERFGRIWEARENILEAIDAQFQVVPKDMASKLNEIRTRETLKALLREAITCQSIDAFRKAVSEASGN